MARLPDYGIDAPTVVRNNALFGLLAIAGGFAAFLYFRATDRDLALSILVNASIACLIMLSMAGYMLWSSKVGKFGVVKRLVSSVAWRGDEQVLDIGCGRGLALIAAAKRLSTGRAVGVDLWSSKDLSGNNGEATLANARAEGVEAKIGLETGDARALTFADATFDVVLSMTALHNINGRTGRATALAEAVRVLKPGGSLVIFDIFRSGEYRKWLRAHGMQSIISSRIYLLWMMPGRILTAKKADLAN